LAVGSLLATPHVLDYDLVVLAVAIAFFARYGCSPFMRSCCGARALDRAKVVVGAQRIAQA
jgi:hypothetical protein